MLRKLLLSAFLLIQLSSAFSSEEKKKPTVCLNMIVKNESKVICRCLESALPLIDYWVIVDTGSTDGTQQVIINYMKEKNIPGTLYEKPWKNFAHNRNEALVFAENTADYVLILDADDYLIYQPEFQLPDWKMDSYTIMSSLGGTEYAATRLLDMKHKWKWEGVVHEYLTSPTAIFSSHLSNVVNFCTRDGARSQDPEKYHKDAQMIYTALQEDPTNTRYTFYLAQSYRDAGESEKALEYYEKRVEMGGWDQEVFYALYQIASLKEHLEYPVNEVAAAYLKAYSFRPTRWEPLYRLARYYRTKANFEAAYRVGRLAADMSPSNDILFVEKWISDYGLIVERTVSAYWTEKYEEAKELCQQIQTINNLPEDIRNLNNNNLRFAEEKLKEKMKQTEILEILQLSKAM